MVFNFTLTQKLSLFFIAKGTAFFWSFSLNLSLNHRKFQRVVGKL